MVEYSSTPYLRVNNVGVKISVLKIGYKKLIRQPKSKLDCSNLGYIEDRYKKFQGHIDNIMS